MSIDKLIELRDQLQTYATSCIVDVYETMGEYGAEWQHLTHLYAILTAWNLMDAEVTRKAEEE